MIRPLIALAALFAVTPAQAITPAQTATRIQYNAQLLVHCGMMSDLEYGGIMNAINDRIIADPVAYRGVQNVNAPVPSQAQCLALRRQYWGY